MDRKTTVLDTLNKYLVELDDVTADDDKLLESLQGQVERIRSLNIKLADARNNIRIESILAPSKNKENSASGSNNSNLHLDKLKSKKTIEGDSKMGAPINKNSKNQAGNGLKVNEADNMRERINKLVKFCK